MNSFLAFQEKWVEKQMSYEATPAPNSYVRIVHVKLYIRV